MFKLKSWLILITGILLTATSAYAKTQYHLEQGACGPGARVFVWWSLTSVDDDGRAKEVWGVDCSGSWYHHVFTVRSIPTDPTSGRVPDIVGSGASGIAYAIITHHDPANGHVLTMCAGRDVHGLFWEATILQ